MKLPHSLYWRVTIAYVAITVVALGILAIYLAGRPAGAPVFAATAFCAGAIGLLFLLIGRYMIARAAVTARSVTAAARGIAQGDLEQRVHGLSPDETQEMAQSFNQMADALRELIRSSHEERNRLSAVLETMADGVMVITRDGRVELMNEAARGMLAVRPRVAVSSRFLEVVRDHDLRQLVIACQSTGARQQDEVELLAGRRFISAIATPLGDAEGASVLLTLHDLTQTRRIEVTRREFVSNVSHELRSPLASVKAMVETLEDGALEDKSAATDFLKRIHREVNRMTNMVNELLELSRLESGQPTLQIAPLNVYSLIEDVITQFKPRAEGSGLALTSRVPDDLPRARADEEKLREVLVNLVDNALKFTPSGGKVTVAATAANGKVRIDVVDTGVGIASEHVLHIFERFYKVDRSRRDAGTGLGLAIAKHIVENHGGAIWAESREGAGSTFSFTVPAME